jgi:hypothetical protein
VAGTELSRILEEAGVEAVHDGEWESPRKPGGAVLGVPIVRRSDLVFYAASGNPPTEGVQEMFRGLVHGRRGQLERAHVLTDGVDFHRYLLALAAPLADKPERTPHTLTTAIERLGDLLAREPDLILPPVTAAEAGALYARRFLSPVLKTFAARAREAGSGSIPAFLLSTRGQSLLPAEDIDLSSIGVFGIPGRDRSFAVPSDLVLVLRRQPRSIEGQDDPARRRTVASLLHALLSPEVQKKLATEYFEIPARRFEDPQKPKGRSFLEAIDADAFVAADFVPGGHASRGGAGTGDPARRAAAKDFLVRCERVLFRDPHRPESVVPGVPFTSCFRLDTEARPLIQDRGRDRPEPSRVLLAKLFVEDLVRKLIRPK